MRGLVSSFKDLLAYLYREAVDCCVYRKILLLLITVAHNIGVVGDASLSKYLLGALSIMEPTRRNIFCWCGTEEVTTLPLTEYRD